MNKRKRNQKNFLIISTVIIIILLCGAFCGKFIQKQFQKELIAKVNTINLMKDLVQDDICYVIGHKSPDTDTVCSAILVSDYLKLYGINCEARVSGNINNETKFIFDCLGINAPKILDDASSKKIILVDHNEYSQSINGMKDADIIGIFDHHGVGDVMTNGPIVSETLNIGSTATIIYIRYKLNDLKIDKKTAFLIASAILSDTSYLKSTTTTDIDRHALKECAKIANITKVDEYYSKIYEASLSYDGMTEKEIFLSDYKEYDMSGTKIGIACVNSINKNNADEMIENMRNVMKEIYISQGMKHLFVSVKNHADNESTLIGYGDGVDKVLEKVFGSVDVIFKPGASRKKDIVPILKKAYETLNNMSEKTKNANIDIFCEVKLLLDSDKVLNDNKEIDDKYKDIFFITKKPKTNSVIYIDTKNLDFYKKGWVNRLRIKDGKNEYNITYKKRYKVDSEDIDKALLKAKDEGFSDFEPEIDWGYDNMTLSYSIETDIIYNDEKNISLPEKDKAISYIKDNMPMIENGDGWGDELLKNADITSPILYKKYSGNYEGQKIDIEVWPIYNKSTNETEYITELSFKSNIKDAKMLKDQLIEKLDDLFILLHEDSLKTQKVLD